MSDKFRERSSNRQNRAKTNRGMVVFSCAGKHYKTVLTMLFILLFAFWSCNLSSSHAPNQEPAAAVANGFSPASDTIIPPQYDAQKQLVRLNKSDAEWRKILNEKEYDVLRQKGTERAFTGDLLKVKQKGTFTCRGCALPLFASKAKFESGTGWPSFWEPVAPGLVAEHSDKSFGMVRTEVLCARCGGHLGHVFDDGPKPTGLRYCINSVSLDFVPE
jgi:peptide-methionine (R)-S-oxide reductase